MCSHLLLLSIFFFVKFCALLGNNTIFLFIPTIRSLLLDCTNLSLDIDIFFYLSEIKDHYISLISLAYKTVLRTKV